MFPFWPSAQVSPSALAYQGGAQIYRSTDIPPATPGDSPPFLEPAPVHPQRLSGKGNWGDGSKSAG